MENEHNYLPTMQAYLTTGIAGNADKEFKFSIFLSSVLYDELVTDNTNTSQPSVNEHLANVTAANNSRIVNCTNFLPLNQTDVSVEVTFSNFNTHLPTKCSKNYQKVLYKIAKNVFNHNND